MMRFRAFTIATLACAITLCAGVGASAQDVFDISSGGQPTITGALGGSVTGSSDVTEDLIVTVNFGELSPINRNNIVRVVVPIAVRSTGPYRVTASLTGAFNANPLAVQRTDIGFGVGNMRRLGNKSQTCSSPHVFTSLFNNDPSLTTTLDASGRAAYPSTLANISTSTTILTGPRLTKGSVLRHEDDNGYVFNAILAIRPQSYAPGPFSATITFRISAGPPAAC